MKLLLTLQNYQLLPHSLFLGGNLTQGFDLVAEGFREEHQASSLERDGASTTFVTLSLFSPKSSLWQISSKFSGQIYCILSLLENFQGSLAISFPLGTLNPVPLALCF